MIIIPNKDKSVQKQLEQLQVSSTLIREHQHKIDELTEHRMRIILELRDKGITYPEMAKYTGTSYQYIYKTIREFIPRDKEGKAINKGGRPRKEKA
jgi:hypothetical protein